MSKMRKATMPKMRKKVTQKKEKRSAAAKTAAGVDPEAVSRVIKVIHDVFEHKNVQEHEFNAVVMSERLSYGAKRESDKEYRAIIDRIRTIFKKSVKTPPQKNHDIVSDH